MDATDTTLRWPRSGSVVYEAGRFTHQAERGFARDYANGELTLHLYSVPARVRIGGTEIAVQPGDLTLTPPDTPLRFDFPHPGVHWCFRLRPVPGRTPGVILPIHHHLGAHAGEARARLERVIDDHALAAGRREHPAAWAASLGAHAMLCWLAARTAAEPQPGRAELAVRKAEALLTSSTSAGLPIAEVARRAGMSRNRLAAAFAARHGTTMAQYRMRFLIRHAQWLMESTDQDLAEIRAQIECADPHRFNKLFRRCTGQSPSAWRAGRVPLITSAPRPPWPDGG